MLWFLLFSRHTSLPFQQLSCRDFAFKNIMFCVLHKVSNVSISMSLKSHISLVIWYKDVPVLILKLLFLSSPSFSPLPPPSSSPLLISCGLISSSLPPPLALSPLPSLPLVSSPLLFFLTSPRPLLLSGQSSLCLLYLPPHFVKDLSGQPSDWSLGSAGDEAILILTGITAKLVVFSTRTVAAE